MTRNIHQIPVRQHNEDRIRRAESWLRRSKVAEVNRQQAVSDEDKQPLIANNSFFSGYHSMPHTDANYLIMTGMKITLLNPGSLENF